MHVPEPTVGAERPEKIRELEARRASLTVLEARFCAVYPLHWAGLLCQSSPVNHIAAAPSAGILWGSL